MKKYVFRRYAFRGFKGLFYGFWCTKNTGHKIMTQEEHPIGLYTMKKVMLSG